MNNKVAIVILNWNGQKFLKQFLPSLIAHSPSNIAEIIIADNDSKDASIAFLKTNYPQIKLIQLDDNHGFTGGYNKALAQIEAEYYVLLNSDVETPEGWLEPMVDFMDKNVEYAACQPKILSYTDKTSFEYAGAAGGFIDKYGYPFCRGRIFDTLEKDLAQYNQTSDIFWATGACLFIRSKDWHEANGLDDNFFAHMEEIDLCWRLQNKGRKIAYIPKSNVFHVGGGTLPNDSPFKLFLNHRNNLYLLYKNLPKGKKFSLIFIRLILDGLSAMLYLMQGKFYGPWIVLKAHFSFYIHLKNLKSQQSKTFPSTLYPKSILWNYFYKKKKFYSELRGCDGIN